LLSPPLLLNLVLPLLCCNGNGFALQNTGQVKGCCISPSHGPSSVHLVSRGPRASSMAGSSSVPQKER
jgi:hypothetical protein